MQIKRNTYQKNIISDFIMGSRDHPTADEVYESVVKMNPNISKATVYRNLKNMVEDGTIKKLELSNSPDRYDYQGHHYHIKCTKCGKIYDLDIPYMDELDKIESPFNIINHDIIFKTVCDKCISKERE